MQIGVFFSFLFGKIIIKKPIMRKHVNHYSIYEVFSCMFSRVFTPQLIIFERNVINLLFLSFLSTITNGLAFFPNIISFVCQVLPIMRCNLILKLIYQLFLTLSDKKYRIMINDNGFKNNLLHIFMMIISILKIQEIFNFNPNIIISIFPKQVQLFQKDRLMNQLPANPIILKAILVCESESIEQGRSYFNSSIDISHCYFSRSVASSIDGGVIFISGGSYSMSVKYSMFYFCIAKNYGAIYFDSSCSILRMICANRCSCGISNSYHFAILITSQENQVEYLSISNCSYSTDGYRSFCLVKGSQRIDNTNSSMNNAIQNSGIVVSSPSTYTSSFCTLSNNKVSDSICFNFNTASGTITMLFGIFVHNNSPSWGVVYNNGAGSRKMMYCIFQNNHNYLFSVRDGSLEVSHSFIDHSESSFSISTPVSALTNNSFTFRMTYKCEFFKSHHCNAEMPLIVHKPMNTIDQMHIRSFSFIIPIVILTIFS